MAGIKAFIGSALAILVLAAALTAGSVRASPANTAASPLVGTWDTGPIPVNRLRAALVARGYTNARVNAFFRQFGISKAYQFKNTFSGGVAPTIFKKAWDPSKGSEPGDADHGPYTLLPNRRFVARGVDPPTDTFREVYSYVVRGKVLKLTLVRLTEPGVSKADLAMDTLMLRAATAFPYKRV